MNGSGRSPPIAGLACRVLRKSPSLLNGMVRSTRISSEGQTMPSAPCRTDILMCCKGNPDSDYADSSLVHNFSVHSESRNPLFQWIFPSLICNVMTHDYNLKSNRATEIFLHSRLSEYVIILLAFLHSCCP
jgi:hypothetical protein